MSIDAMKQALEALEQQDYGQNTEVAKALRLAIEQAERQEPVAWIDHRIHGWPDCFVMEADPPHTSPLYTAPPQRQPLTDEEIKAVIRAGEYDSMEEFARAIERAHGIGGGDGVEIDDAHAPKVYGEWVKFVDGEGAVVKITPSVLAQLFAFAGGGMGMTVTDKQPEALRLADELDAYHTRSCHKEAAAELRRLYAENEDHIQQLRKEQLEVERMHRVNAQLLGVGGSGRVFKTDGERRVQPCRSEGDEMNREDVIRMAREVKGAARQSATDGSLWLLSESHLEAFAELVAAAERDACAKLCEEYETENDIAATWLNIVAAAIRARGEKK